MATATTEATKKGKHLSALTSLSATSKEWVEVDRRCNCSSANMQTNLEPKVACPEGSVMDVWC